jgi:hypothetical protein
MKSLVNNCGNNGKEIGVIKLINKIRVWFEKIGSDDGFPYKWEGEVTMFRKDLFNVVLGKRGEGRWRKLYKQKYFKNDLEI